jgi:hypothetical protein
MKRALFCYYFLIIIIIFLARRDTEAGGRTGRSRYATRARQTGTNSVRSSMAFTLPATELPRRLGSIPNQHPVAEALHELSLTLEAQASPDRAPALALDEDDYYVEYHYCSSTAQGATSNRPQARRRRAQGAGTRYGQTSAQQRRKREHSLERYKVAMQGIASVKAKLVRYGITTLAWEALRLPQK